MTSTTCWASKREISIDDWGSSRCRPIRLEKSGATCFVVAFIGAGFKAVGLISPHALGMVTHRKKHFSFDEILGWFSVGVFCSNAVSATWLSESKQANFIKTREFHQHLSAVSIKATRDMLTAIIRKRKLKRETSSDRRSEKREKIRRRKILWKRIS